MLKLKVAASQASGIPEDIVHTIGSELLGRPRGVQYTAAGFLIYKVVIDNENISQELRVPMCAYACVELCII